VGTTDTMRLTGQSKQGAQPEQTYSDLTKGVRAQPVKSRAKWEQKYWETNTESIKNKGLINSAKQK